MPEAVAVTDPFDVVRLAADALDACRRRVQQRSRGHRGRTGDLLHRARRTLHTGADLLTDRQGDRLRALFETTVHDDAHVEVEATRGIFQRMVARGHLPRAGDHRASDRATGRQLMTDPIDTLATGVPTALTEVRAVGRTLTKRTPDVRAHFDRPGTSNGLTEAINGRDTLVRDEPAEDDEALAPGGPSASCTP